MSLQKSFPYFLFLILLEKNRKTLAFQKQVIFDWGDFPQETLDMVKLQYSQMRAFHSGVSRFFPFIKLCEDIAMTINATLIAKPKYNNSFKSEFKPIPTIRLYATGRPGSDKSLYSILKTWQRETHLNNSTGISTERPLFIQTAIAPLNFAYCDWPRWKSENIWTFPIVTSPMDTKTWLALGITMTLVIIIMTLKWQESASKMALLVISVILSPGISGHVPRYSVLMVLWMLSGGVLVNIYSGGVTSSLIAPPEPDILSNIEELAAHNYSLVYPSIPVMKYIKSFRLRHLDKLLNEAEVFSEKTVYKVLALREKKASVFPWSTALRSLTISDGIAKTVDKNCFVGRELTHVADSMFHIIMPPENKRLFQVFRQFIEAGIYKIWHKEYMMLGVSTRVQDRFRILSPVKIDSPKKPNAQKLTGRMQTVFLLWAVWLAISVNIFVLELMYFYVFCKICESAQKVITTKVCNYIP